MKFFSVLGCACLLLDAATNVAAQQRTLSGKGGKGNKMASSKSSFKLSSSKKTGKGGKGGKAKSSKKSSKKSGKGKGSLTKSPSSMPNLAPTMMPSMMPIAMSSVDDGNDATIVDFPLLPPVSTPIAMNNNESPPIGVDFQFLPPVSTPNAVRSDENPAISGDFPVVPPISTPNAMSYDENSANSQDSPNLSYDDQDRAGTESPSQTATIPIFGTSKPTSSPTSKPTKAPVAPSVSPSVDLSDRSDTTGPSLPIIETSPEPTRAPFVKLTAAPVTKSPTGKPSKAPTAVPTASPTSTPTKTPTSNPTSFPTSSPTNGPTKAPTTETPTSSPTLSPTSSPTVTPTVKASSSPTQADRSGNDGSGNVIPLIDILRGRLESNSYYGGLEFEDPTSYQTKALLRLEEQLDVEWMSDHKLIQYYTLYCIYLSADGPNWKNSDGWTETDLGPCSGWFGVSCDEANYIVGINLYDNNLSGFFPPEVALLASDGYRSTGAGALISLDLYLNLNLNNGNDSYWVSELGSSLKYLFLGKTAFGGSLPPLPTGLIEFDASHTAINGGLTASNFNGLNDLTWLLLDGCNFQTSIPTELANLPKLEYFYISDAKITGDLSYMENMPVLFEHFASNNPGLGGALYSFIGNITSLASLNLAGNGLEGTIPTSFGNLENLQQLWLNDNNLSGRIPAELSELISLETLELQGNSLAGAFPDEICSLKDSYSLTKLGADCSVHECECCTCCSFDTCSSP